MNAQKYKSPVLILLVIICIFIPSYGKSKEFESPYNRAKHGPPLTNIIHKVNKEWLYDWLKDPKHYNTDAKMPNLKLNEEEIIEVVSYLVSIADRDLWPKVSWGKFLFKKEDKMTDEEFEEMDKLYSQGKAIWSQARCSICHTIKGASGKLVGGYVNLHVGIDLSKVSSKINRDWLYYWIKEPKNYYKDTLMPKYRFSDEEIRALVEYIMRDSAFVDEITSVSKEIKLSKDPEIVKKGKIIIELARCVVCHDIKGIKDLITVTDETKNIKKGFEKLLSDVKCMTCHNIQGKGGTYAPELTYAGSKLKKDWIKNFVKSPDVIRPLLQQMPKFNLTEEEAIISEEYIKKNFTTKDITSIFLKKTPTITQIESGKGLFYKKGCQTCHQIEAKGGVLGPNLSEVGNRLEPEYIYFHLKNPHRFKPDAVEPNYGLSDEEAIKLTYFLISLKKEGLKKEK